MSDIRATTSVGYVTGNPASPYVDLEIEHCDDQVSFRIEPEALRRIASRQSRAADEAESFMLTEMGGGTAQRGKCEFP